MRDFLRDGKLLTLMLGHLTVDTYAGVIPVLYPILIGRFRLSLATVGLVSLAYSGMAAVSQPLFGVLADRFGTRFTGVALCWTALTFSLVGFVTSFPLLLLLAFASGLGSGAFHPMGALDVRALLPRLRRSAGMSVYVTAGTVGVAIGPLIGILVFGAFGIHGTGVLIVPGLITGGYLLWRMRGAVESATGSLRRVSSAGSRVPVFALAVVIGVMMSRSWTVNVFQAFTPTWYKQLGYGPEFYGPLATTLVLASAVGTVGCGTLADRYGRRNVIIATLVLSVPAILLYTAFPGPWAFASAILIGVLAASTAPLMLLMAQQLMADRAGLASGLVMGLGFVTGAIGIPINGAIADSIGLQKSLMTHVALVIVTIAIAWFLPSEDRMERLAPHVEAMRARPEAGVP
ncbi:MAG TPA: MFS transporter [Candidatus Dormibacteraeota bacterium]|nr:MFS transporter [Candidatus Dormibacteraeota bacterium]